MTKLSQTHLHKMIMLALLPCSLPYAVYANTDTAATDEATPIERIEITGSRIKRTDFEGITPMVVLTADDLAKQGFANLYDAMSSINMNTGMFVGEENTNNFHANAQSLNLRGFGAGYTLSLLNGRRMPVLPKPAHNLGGNITNLAMIPTSAISRVEILTTGASAIYGSDAVTGVVNYILKDDLDFTELSYRHGNTLHGGGRSERINLVSGHSWSNTNLTFGLEWDKRNPIYGDQRSYFDHPVKSPSVEHRDLAQVMSHWTHSPTWSLQLKDIKAECEALGYVPVQPNRDFADPDPYFCGENTHGDTTLRNQRDRLFGFANLSHTMGQHEFYSTLLATQSKADAGISRYGYNLDYQVVNDVTDPNRAILGSSHIWRRFRDFEVPTSDQSFKDDTITWLTGLRGSLSDYDYSLDLSLGRYNYTDTIGRFNDQAMMGLLFGEKGTDWILPWDGSRWVQVNRSQVSDRLLPDAGLDFFGELTPDMFQSVLHHSEGIGKSTNATFSATLAGSLFEIPAGYVDFAIITEVSRDTYKFTTDDDTINGAIAGWSGIRGSGTRNRYALGVELAIPLMNQEQFGQVDATIAGRYDYYDDASDVGGAFTYQLGLSWKPIDSLMVRASRTTSFRAPDMHVMFAERSSSFATGINYMACVLEEGLQKGDSWQGCGTDYPTGSIRQYSEGDPKLREEKGFSNNFGLVAQLGDHHSVTADLYRIELNDQIGVIGANTVLRYVAECNLGFNQWGDDVDPNSARCHAMRSRINLGGPGNTLNHIITSPFNTGMRRQDGIDAQWVSRIDTEKHGLFSATLGYTHIFKTLYRFLPEDDVENIRDKLWNTEFRTKTNLTLSWNLERFSSNVHIRRQGSSPVRWTDEDYERHSAWTTVNLTTSYSWTDAFNTSLVINNLFDKKPPLHPSEKWWPYFDQRKYSFVGTEVFLQASYRF